MAYLKNMPWVIARLKEQKFAISTNYVREMVRLPKVVSVPQAPPFIRGVMNLRGKVFPVLDMRVKLGMQSMTSEIDTIVELLEKREQDHKNWMNELEASVAEKREFKLTTDPHQCAFGKWYDSYKTDNRMLENCLKKFDEPHKTIHGVAVKVREAIDQQAVDMARELIENIKNRELADMIGLFADARMLLREESREIALCLEVGSRVMSVTVDSIETVEKLQEADIDALPEAMRSINNTYLSGIGKRKNSADLVQLLDMEKMLSTDDSLALEGL